jgi:hypothetical protein
VLRAIQQWSYTIDIDWLLDRFDLLWIKTWVVKGTRRDESALEAIIKLLKIIQSEGGKNEVGSLKYSR